MSWGVQAVFLLSFFFLFKKPLVFKAQAEEGYSETIFWFLRGVKFDMEKGGVDGRVAGHVYSVLESQSKPSKRGAKDGLFNIVTGLNCSKPKLILRTETAERLTYGAVLAEEGGDAVLPFLVEQVTAEGVLLCQLESSTDFTIFDGTHPFNLWLVQDSPSSLNDFLERKHCNETEKTQTDC